jgi:hypothetical protein
MEVILHRGFVVKVAGAGGRARRLTTDGGTSMADDTRERIRDALMEAFRNRGGYWNVTLVPPGTGGALPDRWLLRIHTRPIAKAELRADIAEAFLNDPADTDAVAAWEQEVQAIFEYAKANDELL